MDVVHAIPDGFDPRIIQQAVDLLRQGNIICYPTETFYALGIDPLHMEARQRLYRLKKRPPEKELPLIASDSAMVESWCDTSNPAFETLSKKFWPGPLTLVLYSLDHQQSYAIRVSSHPIAREISSVLGRPVISTSANQTGQPPFAFPQDIESELQAGIALLIDGGPARGGKPSTIVTLIETPLRIIREGAILQDQLLAAL